MALSAGRVQLPVRYRTLAWVGGLFLAINLVLRATLTAIALGGSGLLSLSAAATLAVGLVYDAVVVSYVIVPFAMLATLIPDGTIGRRIHGALAAAMVIGALGAFLVVAVAEVLFWLEFSSRFNFIAVDYLVYTREVLGNIRESYPVGALLAGIGAASAAFAVRFGSALWRTAAGPAGPLGTRLVMLSGVLALPALASVAVGDGLRETLHGEARELAGDGVYEFVRAFRANDLDYRRFYRTIPDAKAEAIVRADFDAAGAPAAFVADAHPLARTIAATAPEQLLNVILVSIESLGADYVESFGGRKGLTPNLDRLARAGIMFTDVYATGLRTVRGLEALTLSLPPTPGHAVPARPDNKGLPTLGGAFNEHGYESLYVYGGYSQFDNMSDFFGGNGYTVVDRTAIPRDRISHETIWGVADEDLYAHAIAEVDRRVAQGRHVFAHVMTTSNHRPFTYPEGRVDIPSGQGRDGAVKYTDHAIGRLIETARTRPWFDDTVFVFVADHTSHGRGRTDLPPENYRIPLVVYAPAHFAPAVIGHTASQIDVAPTLLGLLGFSYTSRFFGQDILREGGRNPRAFLANYLTVGYLKHGMVVELLPKARARVLDAASGIPVPLGDARGEHLVEEAVAHYQLASDLVHRRAHATYALGRGAGSR